MSISSWRWRLTLTLSAAAAAVVALAAPAGAVTGPRWTSPEMAGYVATSAQFKSINAIVYMRNPARYHGIVARFGHSIQLWSAGRVATVGLRASTSGDTYTPYAAIYDRTTHRVIASNPNHTGGGPWHFGVAMQLGIWYRPATGQLEMGVADVTGFSGFSFTSSYPVGSQSFTQARVGTEFGSSPWDTSYPYTPPATPVKAARYSAVSLVTYNGHTSTLWSWWVHHKLLAEQSSSNWVAIPHNLYLDGLSFHTWFVPKSAQSSTQPAAS